MTDHRPDGAASARMLATLDEAAVVVAMTMVPELYSRNRMYSLMSDPRLRRARRRAIGLRTAVRQMASGGARNVELTPCGSGFTLAYEVPRLAYVRRLELTNLERATLAMLVHRAGSNALPCSEEDRQLVERAIASLAQTDELPAPRAAGER